MIRDTKTRLDVVYAVARSIAVVSVVFSLVVAVFLVMNFLRRDSAPLQESVGLDRLRTELRGNPGDSELRQQIQALDTLARRAFFTSVTFATNGALLLCGGLAILMVSLKTMGTIQKRLPDPGKFSADDDVGADDKYGRRAIGGAAAVLVVICIAVVLTVKSHLSPGDDGIAPAREPYVPSDEDVFRNWPGFRGPRGIGVAHCTNVPVQWDGKTGENVRWEVEVPLSGFSSPVVWGTHLFLTGGDEKSLMILCYDTDTGKLLWRREVDDGGPPEKLPKGTEDTGYAAATMATDGRRAFAIFATGDLLCTDFDGNVMWSRNLGFPKSTYGYASSLITHAGLLFVQYDEADNPRLIAMDAHSGRTKWETKRKVDESWASPILVDNAGRIELVLNANPLVAGYDPDTGREIWSTNCMERDVAPSPAFAGGIVYATTEYSILAAIKPGVPAQILWQTDEDLPSVSSPVAVGDYLFLADGGIVTCFDRTTGTVHWKQKFDTGFYSSPVYAEGRIYLVDEAGVMHVLAADKEFKLLASSRLSGKSVCTPAFMEGRIYIRGNKTLCCVEE